MASRNFQYLAGSLQAAVAAHEDVDVLVLALGAREQLEPHRRDLVEDPARGDRVVLREVGPEFQILVELPQGPSGGAVVDRVRREIQRLKMPCRWRVSTPETVERQTIGTVTTSLGSPVALRLWLPPAAGSPT